MRIERLVERCGCGRELCGLSLVQKREGRQDGEFAGGGGGFGIGGGCLGERCLKALLLLVRWAVLWIGWSMVEEFDALAVLWWGRVFL